MAFDPSTLGTAYNPWSDGSGALLRHVPVLPDGLSVGTPVALDFGLKYPCSGPLSAITVTDFRSTNHLDAFADFDNPGIQILWEMPVSAIRDDGGGVWRPKRSLVSGSEQVNAYIQPSEIETIVDGEVSSSRPEWAAGSIAYYGPDHKRNVSMRPDGSILKPYGTEKLWHSPRPTAWFWKDRRLLGIVKGWLEWDAANSHEVKAFPLADCMVYVNGGADAVSIDATLGYTTAGASQGYVTAATWMTVVQMGAMTEAGTATALDMALHLLADNNDTATFALYVGSGDSGDSRKTYAVPTALVPTHDDITARTFIKYTFASSVSLNNGDGCIGAIHKPNTLGSNWSVAICLDTGGASNRSRRRFSTAVPTPPPDPIGTAGATTNTTELHSAYVTYTAGGGPSGKAIYLHLYKLRGQ